MNRQSYTKQSYETKKLIQTCLIFTLLLLITGNYEPAYALTMTPTWSISSDAWPTTNLKLQTTNLPPSTGDTAYVNEGNGGPEGTTQQFGQTFSPTAGFHLTGIAVTISGPAMSITVALYDVGVNDGNAFVPASITLGSLTKLWEGTASFPGSAGETIAMFNFSGDDLIELQANEKYIFTITTSITTQNQFIWYRSATTAYTGGQMYRGSGTLDTLNQVASWSVRVAGLAAYGIIPSKATNPTPADEANNVSLVPTLSWTADTNASSYDVYFGTDFNEVRDADVNDANVYQGNQTETTFDPGTLESNTTYYWRVDEKNVLGTTTGDVWSFTTGNYLPLTITKCQVKAGKTQGADSNDINNIKDSIKISGTADFHDDANQATQLDVNIISMDDEAIIYTQTITDINSYLNSAQNKITYTHKIPKGQPGEITLLKLDFVNNNFILDARNIDLTGLGGTVKLELIFRGDSDVYFVGEANEAIVNGKKRIQCRFMRMYQNMLIVTNAKAKHSTKPLSDSLSVKGEIAVENICNTDMNEPNLAVLDVNFIWGDQTFTIREGDLIAAKTGHKYSCKNVPSDANEGLVTANLDLDKCTFTLTIKEANNLNALPDNPEVNFSINYGLGDANDFNETADVNLVTRRSY